MSSEGHSATYHIISKDSGFDPLIRYLKDKGLDVQRSKEIADIPLLRVPSGGSVPDKIEAIVRNLVSRGTGRPRKVRTLKNTINSLFGKSLEDSELAELIRVLTDQGHIRIHDDHISYHLSPQRG